MANHTGSKLHKKSQQLRIQRLPPRPYFDRQGETILTFGVFDGLHQGHHGILNQIIYRAKTLDAHSVVIVFRPRPIDILEIQPARPYFTAQNVTVKLIRDLGVNHVGVLKFDKELVNMTATKFLHQLQKRVPFRELWLGPHASVGRGNEGSLESVQQIGKEMGFSTHIFNSSSEDQPMDHSLQSYFENKDIESVSKLLGRRYSLPAYVSATATDIGSNLVRFLVQTPKLLYVPPAGEYAVWVKPTSFLNVRPDSRAAEGPAALIIKTNQSFGGISKINLVGNPELRWAGEFINIEFITAYKMPLENLWQWAISQK